MRPPIVKPPVLKVTWHHLREFVFGMPPMIWLEIENLGSSASLTIDGSIGKAPMGKATYELPENGYIELGFLWGRGPKITCELMDEQGYVHYFVCLRLENKRGSDTYTETKRIFVNRS